MALCFCTSDRKRRLDALIDGGSVPGRGSSLDVDRGLSPGVFMILSSVRYDSGCWGNFWSRLVLASEVRSKRRFLKRRKHSMPSSLAVPPEIAECGSSWSVSASIAVSLGVVLLGSWAPWNIREWLECCLSLKTFSQSKTPPTSSTSFRPIVAGSRKKEDGFPFCGTTRLVSEVLIGR